MNLWLDDVRLPPSSEWVWVKTAMDALKELRRASWGVISLDHDLGEDAGTGYDVLTYLEAEAYRNPEFKIPEIRVHTANTVARARMLQAVTSIERMRPNP
jgi:hypothetical protein